MEDIIAGRFETDDEARSAAASLSAFAGEGDIFIFFNNQPGAHDSNRDRAGTGDRGAAKGAAGGAASGPLPQAPSGHWQEGPAWAQ